MSSNEESEKGENVRRVRREGGEQGGVPRVPLFDLSHLRTASRSSLILAGIVVLAVLGWIAVALWGDRQRAWGILFTDFLFLSCLGGGLVVWPAIVVAARGQWMGSTQNIALLGVFLLPVCLVILIVLAVGAPAWAPWLHQNVSNSWWLNTPFLFLRDTLGLAIFIGLAVISIAAVAVAAFYPWDLAAQQPVSFSHRVHAGKKEIGCGTYYVPALLRTKLWSEPLGWVAFVLWNLAVLSGPVGFSFAFSQGREYAEYIWLMDLAIVLAVLAMLLNAIMTILHRKIDTL